MLILSIIVLILNVYIVSMILSLRKGSVNLQEQIADNAKLSHGLAKEVVFLYEKTSDSDSSLKNLVEENDETISNIEIIDYNTKLNAKKLDEVIKTFNEKIKNDKILVEKLQSLLKKDSGGSGKDPFKLSAEKKKIFN